MDLTFSVQEHEVITATLTKNFSHYFTTGPISLAACSTISHEICMVFFQNIFYPWPWRGEGSVQTSSPIDP